ncbi:Guanine nucleotide exchange factor LTE1 [Ceratobasidium sp. AG-Ba]|nr:Guanine nucleotide exchange factor LTE1 [Ceratobasidium sp. AG-Ba]
MTTVTPTSPLHVGTLPNVPLSNFKYSKSGALVFSAYVYEDFNLSSVREQDEKWENRGNTALVYDSNYVRHWDEYTGPKRQAFSVDLAKVDGKWKLGSEVFPFSSRDTAPPLSLLVAPKTLTKDGKKVAWTEMTRDGYESDRSKLVIYDLEAGIRFTVTEDWDQSVGDLSFTPDGKSIIFTSGHHAPKHIPSVVPVALTTEHTASSPQALPGGRVSFTSSSLTHPNNVTSCLGWRTGNVPPEVKITRVSNFAESGLADLKLTQGELFWFTGAQGKKVQGWIVRPPGADESAVKEGKKWPVVLLIHGGPQGYVVVAINPTGSTTFGQEFTDAIAGDWGGKPFEDLRKGLEIDSERVVAVGASWGGYAINWIQGHPEFGFKLQSACLRYRLQWLATDELYFFNHDFGGPPWDAKSRKTAEKFQPGQFCLSLVDSSAHIHGSKDYRLAETEGLGAFNALQSRGVPSRIVIFPDENHWVLKLVTRSSGTMRCSAGSTSTLVKKRQFEGWVDGMTEPPLAMDQVSPTTPTTPSFAPNNVDGQIDYSQPVAILLRTSTARAHDAIHHSNAAARLLRGELPRDDISTL